MAEAAADTNETRLSPAEEPRFQAWLDQHHAQGAIRDGDYNFYKQHGYGYDYDFRAAFKAGLSPAQNGHWPDLGKKPNHPTFSDQSMYANAPGARPGKWSGDAYVPPTANSQSSPAPAPLPGAATDTFQSLRDAAVSAMRKAYTDFGPWTAKRGKRLIDMPGNYAKGVLGTGPALTAMAGALGRSVPDIAAATFNHDPMAQARLGGNALAIGGELANQAVAAVKDPVGTIIQYPFELEGAGNLAARAVAGTAAAGARAAGAAADARTASIASGAPANFPFEHQVWQGVKEASQALRKPAEVVAEHGAIAPAAKAADAALRTHVPLYDALRTHQDEGAAVSKVLSDAGVNEQIARNNDLKKFWKQYGDLSDEQKADWAQHAAGLNAGPPADDRVALAVQAFKQLDAQTQHEWMGLGRDLGPVEQIARYQPARIEAIGEAFPRVLRARAGGPPVEGTPIEAEVGRAIDRRGFLKSLEPQVSSILDREFAPPGAAGAAGDAADEGSNVPQPMTHEDVAQAAEQDPAFARHLGFQVEKRLQFERASKVPGTLQPRMPRISTEDTPQPGMLPRAPGARRTYQLTRQEFEAMSPKERAKRLRSMDIPEGTPPEQVYDHIIGKAIDRRKDVPLEVLEQHDDWMDRALSPPNRRLMRMTDEVREALAKKQSTQPIYFPMMREPQALTWRNLFRRPAPAQKPGSPFKQRLGGTYASGEWVKDPRVLAARMTGQLRSYQKAQAIFEGTLKAISEGKIRGRVIAGPWELKPGEAAWNPDGVKMWSRQVEFGQQFLKHLETFGASEEGAARGLAAAIKGSIDEGAFSAVDQGYAKPTVYAIPTHVAKMLSNEFKEAPGFIRYFYDPATAAWRWAVLTARPAWIMNNTIGNILFSTLNGVAPRHYLMALQEQFRAKTPDNLNGVRLTAQESNLGLTRSTGGPLGEFFEWLDSKPTPVGALDAVTGERPSAAQMALRVGDPRRFKAALDWVSRAMNATNSSIETFYRSANYIKESEKLVSEKTVQRAAGSGLKALSLLDEMDSFSPAETDKIIAQVNYFMHDYAALAPWERTYLRRAIPFVNFMKHQTRLLLQLPIDYPGRAAMLQAMVAVGKEMQSQDNAKLPPWARDRGYMDTGVDLTLDGRPVRAFIATGGMNPFMVGYGPAVGADDPQAEDFGIPEGIQFGYEAAGPVIRSIGASAKSGADLMSGRVLKVPHKVQRDGKWYDSRTNLPTSPPWIDPVSFYVSQFPQVQLARKLINPRSGYPGAPLSLDTYHAQATTSWLAQLLKYFTPVSIVFIDQKDMRMPPRLLKRDRKAIRRAGRREEALREMDQGAWWNPAGRGPHTDVGKPGTAPADSLH